MMSSFAIQRLAILMILFGLPAVACGAPVEQPAAGGSARHGGILNVRWSEDPWDWDMSYTGQSTVNSDSMRLAYNSLLGFKIEPGVRFDEFIVQGELAERWEVSPDARAYTFYLRKGARFADLPPVNGREVTAADAKWSMEYWSRTGQFAGKGLPQGQTEWMYEGLQAVETPDPYTVVVRFKEPFAPFLNYAASDTNPVVPKEIYEEDGDLKSRIVGTGPWQLDTAASQKGSRWVFKKHPHYWDSGKPYLDEVRQLLIKDDAAAHAAFQTRQIDQIAEISDAVTAQNIQSANPEAVRYEYVSAPLYILMHTRRAPLSDARIRRAVSMSADRDDFVKVLAGGKGVWALAGTGPLSDLFSQEEIKGIVKQDVAEARRLVAEAGYPQGVEVEFHIPTDRGDRARKLGELLQAQVKRAGINLVLRTMPYSDVSARRKKHDFMMDYFNEFPRPDVDAVIYSTFYPGEKANYTEVDDPKLTALLVAQRRETDAGKRRDLVRQAVRYIAEQDLGMALTRETRYIFWHPYLKNYTPHMDKGIPNYASAAVGSWLEK